MRQFQIFATALLAVAMTGAAAQTPAASRPPLGGEARPRDTGPATLSAEQVAKVKTVLSAYKPASLTVGDAKALKRALRDAGLRPGPALDKALADAGFSAAQLEVLDPRPARPPGDGDAPAGPPPPRK